jgi:RNA polymerase sigma-70 factor, ECF subfamily
MKSPLPARLPKRATLRPHPPDASGGEIDRELMVRISRGDQEAFGTLLGRYWKPLVQYALRLQGESDAAEDLVQEAFVRLWERREGWVPSGSPRSYLYRIVRNLALQDQEKVEVRARWRAALLAEQTEGVSPDVVLDSSLLARDVSTALDRLPPRRQEIVVLARFHGFSHREIAELMGISQQTVSNQMSTALRDLRMALIAHQPAAPASAIGTPT